MASNSSRVPGQFLLGQVLFFDPEQGSIDGREQTSRHLSDLPGSFADQVAYARLLEQNPLLYQVTQVEEQNGPGQLHYGIGILMPGKVGGRIFHDQRASARMAPAAEIYVGLRGRGMMLLEDEQTGRCDAVPLEANSVVYVPGHTAHRTVNVGHEPLVYWGILSSEAGHDYGTVGARNFSKVLVDVEGTPTLLDRAAFLTKLQANAR